MTGLKSGSGDDLWGDDGDADDGDDPAQSAAARDDTGAADAADAEAAEPDTGAAERDDSTADRAPETDETPAAGQEADDAERRPVESATGGGSTAGADRSDGPSTESSSPPTDESGGDIDLSAIEPAPSGDSQPYIVRRAVQDKSVQFERDERLTFFVHDDVAEGERDLITELQSVLGRDVPKFDVREAVYRAALRNPDDVLEELLEMGYSVDEE